MLDLPRSRPDQVMKMSRKKSTDPVSKASYRLGWRLLVRLALLLSVCGYLECGIAQGVKAPIVLQDDSVSPGTLGHVTYQTQPSAPTTPPTNADLIVIGSSTYAVLTPNTNATLMLSVSTTDTNGIELAVYSLQSLYTLVAADSSKLDHTNVASVSFLAIAGVTYDIQLTGVGTITFNYGLGIPTTFSQTQSSEAVAAGCPVTFGATAAGMPAPTFQWQFQDADIPGRPIQPSPWATLRRARRAITGSRP